MAESLRSGRLPQQVHSLGAKIRQQRVEMTPVHYNVMGGEGEPDFVFSAFCIEELSPRQHVGALEQNDFQSARTLVSGRYPSLWIIARYRGHRLSRSWVHFSNPPVMSVVYLFAIRIELHDLPAFGPQPSPDTLPEASQALPFALAPMPIAGRSIAQPIPEVVPCRW